KLSHAAALRARSAGRGSALSAGLGRGRRAGGRAARRTRTAAHPAVLQRMGGVPLPGAARERNPDQLFGAAGKNRGSGGRGSILRLACRRDFSAEGASADGGAFAKWRRHDHQPARSAISVTAPLTLY